MLENKEVLEQFKNSIFLIPDHYGNRIYNDLSEKYEVPKNLLQLIDKVSFFDAFNFILCNWSETSML